MELIALNYAAQSLAKNFEELPFAKETDFINTFFKKEVQEASTSVEGQSASQVQKVMYGSVDQTAKEIQSAATEAVGEAAAVSADAASIAAKAFGASMAVTGILSSALFFGLRYR